MNEYGITDGDMATNRGFNPLFENLSLILTKKQALWLI